ncbi:MAG TPA: ABC-F family ATP-binding cassette domain-containing protein [Lachnospiraceae bacterium]|nr:ABC-F family ATP-binding cassette domain-containing protein [Lachnospiraceae bacterium]HPF29404.1 ABC-F family ATP-binding cassette domain-containing protein [Lachnospiraceae bacterium]
MTMDNILVAENLVKSYGIRNLFNQISMGIHEGDRIGLIGINGTGKSTLLRILAGMEEVDHGTITRNNGLRITFLPQKPDFDESKTILENVLMGQKAEEEYRNLEGEATAMLAKLGITDVMADTTILSGGQKKRVALVRTFLTPTDLLILDEPTNHLDSDMTEWLEEMLGRFKGAYVMVTHDRYFLDEVTNKIWELDKGKIYSYQANYSGYVEMKAARERDLAASEQKNKNLYRTELAWMLRGARARATKQKAHIQRFIALRDRPDLELDSEVTISSAYSRLGKKTVELTDISKAYGDRVLFRNFSDIFLQNARIGIIGPNGCGKSTLIKVLTGQIPPDSGHVEFGTTVRYGVFLQENEALKEELRVIDYVRETAEYIPTKNGVITASQMCENFLFTGDMQYSVISKLSGGEKRRLYLLKILMGSPNVLILDEPTNDLDIKTLTILENYLLEFEGIVLAVSHDRYFLDKIATSLLIFRGNGVIEQQEGNYTDYREREMQRTSVEAEKAAKPLQDTETGARKQKTQRLRFTYQEQKDYDVIEEEIDQLESKLARLEEEMNAASSQYSRLEELAIQKDEVEQQLEEKMERWLYLQELDEKIKNSK